VRVGVRVGFRVRVRVRAGVRVRVRVRARVEARQLRGRGEGAEAKGQWRASRLAWRSSCFA